MKQILNDKFVEGLIEAKKESLSQVGGFNANSVAKDIEEHTAYATACPLIFCDNVMPTQFPVPMEFVRFKFSEFVRSMEVGDVPKWLDDRTFHRQISSICTPICLNGMTTLTLSLCWKIIDSVLGTDIFDKNGKNDQVMDKLIWDTFNQLKSILNYQNIYTFFESKGYYIEFCNDITILNEMQPLPEAEMKRLDKALGPNKDIDNLVKIKNSIPIINKRAMMSDYMVKSKVQEAYVMVMQIMAQCVDLICRNIFCNEEYYDAINRNSKILKLMAEPIGCRFINYGVLCSALNLIVCNFAEVGYAAIGAEIERESYFITDSTIEAYNIFDKYIIK